LKTNARLITVLVRWNSIFIPAKLQQHNKNQFWGFDRAYKKAITCIFINSWRLQPILVKSEYRSVPPARSIPGISFSIQVVLWTKQRQARTCVGDAWHWKWNLDAENSNRNLKPPWPTSCTLLKFGYVSDMFPRERPARPAIILLPRYVRPKIAICSGRLPRYVRPTSSAICSAEGRPGRR
jgi:hypothetical protein